MPWKHDAPVETYAETPADHEDRMDHDDHEAHNQRDEPENRDEDSLTGWETPDENDPDARDNSPAAATLLARANTRHKRNLTGRSHGIFARRTAERISIETMLARAQFLPKTPRTILQASFGSGVSIKELATLHNTTPLRMWRSINHWRDTLSDPTFLLAAAFRQRLPFAQAKLMELYWIHCLPLRQVARQRQITIHQVRKQLALARSELVLVAMKDGAVPTERVRKLL